MLQLHHHQGAQINTLPDSGVTVTPKNVGDIVMQIFM